MTTLSRVVKANGSTDWQDNDDFPASEINGDLNAFANWANGSIDDGNLASASDIDVTKIGDNASTDSAFNATAASGDSLSPARPTDLKGEIEALRHQVKMLQGGAGLQARNASGAMVDLGWNEPRPVGPNLFPNPGLDLQSGGAGTAPNGWTLSGSPSTCVVEAAISDAAGTDKTSLNIIGDGVGITYTLSGLRSGTKYRIGAEYIRTAETFTVTTSGGLGGSANYGDLSFSDSSSGVLSYFNGVVQTDSSGSDLVVNFRVSGGASAEVNLFRVWAQEMSESLPVYSPPPVPTVVVVDDLAQSYEGVTTGVLDSFDHTELDISSAAIPAGDYEVDCHMVMNTSVDGAGSSFNGYVFSLMMDVDGGGYSVVNRSAVAIRGTEDNHPFCVNLRHIVPNPTIGSVYSFRMRIEIESGATRDVRVNPVIDSANTESRAFLSVRRI